MQACEAKTGRVFVLRLEDGDTLPQCVEQFAADNNILAATVHMVGGIGSGELVCGPLDPQGERHNGKILPMSHPINSVHEAEGFGTIFPNADNEPVLHMHLSLGRGGLATTGCIRPGVNVWLVGEMVIQELTDIPMSRQHDEFSGFSLLAKDKDLDS